MPNTAGPPWRTIFRFNGDYSVLLPRTAFRKAAGPAGRASSGDPTPPPSRAVQTSRVHCSWNTGPRSFQDQGEPIGCRPQQGPGPWQTPWQLDRSLGEHTDDHVSSGSAPECVPHTTHPRSRRGAAREPLTAGGPPLALQALLPQVCSFQTLGWGPWCPKGNNARGDLFCRQGRSCPAQGGGLATSLSPLPLPHTDWIPAAACLQREPAQAPSNQTVGSSEDEAPQGC